MPASQFTLALEVEVRSELNRVAASALLSMWQQGL